MIALLAGASALAVVVGEFADSLAIAAILLLNGVVGFAQEYRAERAVLALRSLTAPRARVLRDGHPVTVPAGEVVVGDVLVLEAGDVVAADGRLQRADVLSVNEAALTGESLPAEKGTTAAHADAPLAEQCDHVFAGTSVATGTGLAEVTATGMGTQLGRIAGLLAATEEEPTPLQRRLEAVSRMLLRVCGGAVAVVGLLSWWRGLAPLDVVLTSVSLAIAAVPEGLPAVVTIALALGVRRMAERNVLVRRMAAVEGLGAATVICTDKTGTLTTGRMAVRELWGVDEDAVLRAAANVCDAEPPEGDPTEVAIMQAAAVRGFERPANEEMNPRVRVRPFDAVARRMSILRADGTLYVKGALDSLAPLCDAGVQGAEAAAASMAGRGLRVLAVATGKGAEERHLTLLGLIGLADPPRTEAIEAVAAARRAGVTPVMITGDHPITARAIAREMGIVAVDEDPDGRVHARATPEQKLEIVRNWRRKGAIVAMTGDGVNDAPALKEADVGIAMGRGGTEVTREAADVVLADDNFASIVAGIREGRGIWDNLRNTLVYLLMGNAGEILVMLGASLAGLPGPLLPLLLLWINLVTDGLPALALVTDPPARDVLERPPRSPDEPLLGRTQWAVVAAGALVETAVVLGVYAWALAAEGVETARNLAFSTLVFSELFRAFAARSATLVFWEVGPFTNLRVLAVVLLSSAVQLALHHVPALRSLFHLHPLSLTDCALSMGLALIPVTVLELAKLVVRAGAGRARAAAH
jgi:Ca2+-transporting ATPase